MESLTLRIGGEGGEGVISCGEILTRSAARSGYHAFTYRTYPAEIRGGLSMFQLRVDSKAVLSAGDKLDVLVAFNQEALDNYLSDVRSTGVVLYDPASCPETGALRSYDSYEVPLNEICKEATESIRGKNVVAMGVLGYLLSIPMEKAAATVKQQFAKKGSKIVGSNTLALVAGYQYASEKLALDRLSSLPPKGKNNGVGERLILSGNQAVAMGALAAGVRFCGGYPITPATPIFEFMARELPRFGGYVIQFEDEISAIGACLGASYSGNKVIIPTSGPGMALMSEFISLASMAELPILIVDVQRSGPSTGMPTKSEQGDLNFALYGTPGESPRVVLAPASVEECFDLAALAVNVAERYQLPVVLLSDASLAYRTETVNRFDVKKMVVNEREEWSQQKETLGYRRYALTDSGVSPMARPGTEHGEYQATGLEHDEFGHPNYTPEFHEAMQKKRYQKLERMEAELGDSMFYQSRPVGARVGIISWGSTQGTVREAIRMAEAEKIKVAHFHPKVINPLPKKALKKFVSHVRKLIVVEENFTGQLANVIRAELQVDLKVFTKAQGIPFSPDEIYDAIRKTVGK